MARSYGCELVMPPLLEHLESLLPGANRALEIKTLKLVDPIGGRMLGLRADSTLQVARIDAHLLNRAGVTRLCYCGPVLHGQPSGWHATREPLQFGAEVYGHAGLEADLEVQDLALDCLRSAGLAQVTLDLGDARLVRGLLAGVMVGAEVLGDVYAALGSKDVAALRVLSRDFPAEVREALQTLISLYGDAEVLKVARDRLPTRPLVTAALDDLAWIAGRVAQTHPEAKLGFDLADIGENGYYSGMRFAAFVSGSADSVARGGRYDEVGAAFGRSRAAVGFSLDLKVLGAIAPMRPLHAAIRAPWAEDEALRAKVRALRETGETVACVLPGHEQEAQEFACDRELVRVGGAWIVRPL